MKFELLCRRAGTDDFVTEHGYVARSLPDGVAARPRASLANRASTSPRSWAPSDG